MNNRVIKLSELRDAINEAYEEYKSMDAGTVDARVTGADPDNFAISVALTDGTVINKGDASVEFPIGQISRIPVTSLRIEQKAAEQHDGKKCCCKDRPADCKAKKPDIPFGARGIKAISKLQPQGDPDSKWNFIVNRLISLIGSKPTLDVKLYEELKKEAADNDFTGKIKASEYPLKDDVEQSVDLYLRGLSMKVNTQQLAEMGATIAADGVNPFTRQTVYDGVLSQRLVARLALKSHKLRRFIMKTGLPASAGFGGGVVGVLPGVLAIAAYSPRLCDNGVSIRASRAIAYVMKKLELSVFSSEHVTIIQ